MLINNQLLITKHLLKIFFLILIFSNNSFALILGSTKSISSDYSQGTASYSSEGSRIGIYRLENFTNDDSKNDIKTEDNNWVVEITEDDYTPISNDDKNRSRCEEDLLCCPKGTYPAKGKACADHFCKIKGENTECCVSDFDKDVLELAPYYGKVCVSERSNPKDSACPELSHCDQPIKCSVCIYQDLDSVSMTPYKCENKQCDKTDKQIKIAEKRNNFLKCVKNCSEKKCLKLTGTRLTICNSSCEIACRKELGSENIYDYVAPVAHAEERIFGLEELEEITREDRINGCQWDPTHIQCTNSWKLACKKNKDADIHMDIPYSLIFREYINKIQELINYNDKIKNAKDNRSRKNLEKDFCSEFSELVYNISGEKVSKKDCLSYGTDAMINKLYTIIESRPRVLQDFINSFKKENNCSNIDISINAQGFITALDGLKDIAKNCTDGNCCVDSINDNGRCVGVDADIKINEFIETRMIGDHVDVITYCDELPDNYSQTVNATDSTPVPGYVVPSYTIRKQGGKCTVEYNDCSMYVGKLCSSIGETAKCMDSKTSSQKGIYCASTFEMPPVTGVWR